MQSDNSNFKIEFYKRLVRFSVDVVKYTQELRPERSYWPLLDQVVRSATSIGANITEARSSSSKREYIKYFEIALKSANETIFWFDVLAEIADSKKLLELQAECKEIAAIIASRSS